MISPCADPRTPVARSNRAERSSHRANSLRPHGPKTENELEAQKRLIRAAGVQRTPNNSRNDGDHASPSRLAATGILRSAPRASQKGMLVCPSAGGVDLRVSLAVKGDRERMASRAYESRHAGTKFARVAQLAEQPMSIRKGVSGDGLSVIPGSNPGPRSNRRTGVGATDRAARVPKGPVYPSLQRSTGGLTRPPVRTFQSGSAIPEPAKTHREGALIGPRIADSAPRITGAIS